ncbi:hypothetical protein D3C80_1559370 [compost metagenome]
MDPQRGHFVAIPGCQYVQKTQPVWNAACLKPVPGSKRLRRSRQQITGKPDPARAPQLRPVKTLGQLGNAVAAKVQRVQIWHLHNPVRKLGHLGV